VDGGEDSDWEGGTRLVTSHSSWGSYLIRFGFMLVTMSYKTKAYIVRGVRCSFFCSFGEYHTIHTLHVSWEGDKGREKKSFRVWSGVAMIKLSRVKKHKHKEIHF
jgi:hypothetical protein